MKADGVHYSIKELEKISGIKAHTIRIWEQRYGVLEPKRTQTNIRYYDGEDLKVLLNISLLNLKGLKISKIAKMTREEMYEAINSYWDCCDKVDTQVNALTLAMMELDEGRFERTINQNILKQGLENTISKVIYPFFEKVGLLWQTCSINPAQEHFISNLIRQKVIVAIDGQMPVTEPSAEKFLLYLPEGEYHELGLLIGSYILKSRQKKVIYLGQSLPFTDLETIYDTYSPDYLFTIITATRNEKELKEYLTTLGKSFPNSIIFVSGNDVVLKMEDVPSNIKIMTQMPDMIDYLANKNQAA